MFIQSDEAKEALILDCRVAKEELNLKITNTENTLNNKSSLRSDEKISIIANACEKISQASEINLIIETASHHIQQLLSTDIFLVGLFDEK